jgi:hypothetical protein
MCVITFMISREMHIFLKTHAIQQRARMTRRESQERASGMRLFHVHKAESNLQPKIERSVVSVYTSPSEQIKGNVC